ncbi:MAG: UDP-N-acetylglucosamine 1-carboxyvinyltransferase [Clostridiaceae bacterium]|nr:UDP-N-acetylglucosamine 1-carboxyvinyltransferase [Eubacteriales bacterium]
MARFIVTGGRPLHGSLRVSGAKNAALPILAACLLSDAPVALAECPELKDVGNMLSILSDLGAAYEREGGLLHIDASKADSFVMPSRISKELRSSIFTLGPLLGRFQRAVCTYPGGCEIGHRPIDLHLKGLSMLGVEITEEHGQILCDGRNMHGAEIHLDYPSVGATENIIMGAVRADGETIIHNAAREPEIVDLQRFLCSMGFFVSGAGTSDVRITGTKAPTKSVVHSVIPDRIVAGTMLCAAAIAGGEVTLNNVRPEHMASVLSKLREAGAIVLCGEHSVYLRAPDRLREVKIIETLPYPGFPTDMQAQFFALCTVAEGTSVVVENVFEGRFKHAAELARMGAMFTQKDRTAVIRGVKRLTGTQVYARDLRGGAALTIAGLVALGETTVMNAELIDRGYEGMERMLTAIGARIRREED